MPEIETITQDKQIQAALAYFKNELDSIVDLAIQIQQIPAPTFAEATRASFIEAQMTDLGLKAVAQDELHNVYGRLPGRDSQRPPVIISAHSDTVFPAGTDLTVRREENLVHGPGIGDNSTGVAGILTVAGVLQQFGIRSSADLWFVANVGEEGLGDLRGMRAVVERFGPQARYIVVEGGLYGQISHQAIGVRRFRIEVEAKGGHSWGSFGNRSAIHELGRMITAVDRLDVPKTPKTTYNVGVIEGGTSINSIAQHAHMLLDLRSEAPDALADLVAAVEKIVAQVNKKKDVTVAMTLIGNRPAGEIPRSTPLVQQAEAALRHVGCDAPSFIRSSTDANVPLSLGYTAVCIGLTESSHAHRRDEYMDTTHLPAGLSQLLLLALATE